jgi:hypothetical protein
MHIRNSPILGHCSFCKEEMGEDNGVLHAGGPPPGFVALLHTACESLFIADCEDRKIETSRVSG